VCSNTIPLNRWLGYSDDACSFFTGIRWIV